MTVDAYDWVMVPNALGMILYADGGYIATKPYAAGGGLHPQDEQLLRGLPVLAADRKPGRTPVRSTRCTGTSTTGTRTGCATTRASAARSRPGKLAAKRTGGRCARIGGEFSGWVVSGRTRDSRLDRDLRARCQNTRA